MLLMPAIRQECENESSSISVVDDDSVKEENLVHRTLSRLRSIHGLVSASLVEPDSAHVLETVATGSDASAAATTVAAAASDIAQVIALLAAGLGEPDDLEDVIITLGRRHHLIRPLPGAGSDGLLIVLTLDRAGTNLAMARQQLRALGPLLDAATTPSRAS
jgi:hypothetical protein